MMRLRWTLPQALPMMDLLLYVSRHFPYMVLLYATSVMSTAVHSSVSGLDSTMLQHGTALGNALSLPYGISCSRNILTAAAWCVVFVQKHLTHLPSGMWQPHPRQNSTTTTTTHNTRKRYVMTSAGDTMLTRARDPLLTN